ncbi:MAG: BrnA antitoxin family protein [Rhodospirillaceae bacterium]|nr:BrnA antitoxin family protein [Rhodospirillaceae bacterium]
MTKRRIVRMSLDEALARGGGDTDWARVNAMTDEDIAANVASDPDAYETPPGFWDDAVLVYPPRKKVVTLGIDDDVLAFFKRSGKGYQSRINAVLRTFMVRKSQERVAALSRPARRPGKKAPGLVQGLAEPTAKYRTGKRK